MENAEREEVRSLMLSAQMDVPEYSADPIVQRRVGNMLSDVSRRLFFAPFRLRGPYSV